MIIRKPTLENVIPGVKCSEGSVEVDVEPDIIIDAVRDLIDLLSLKRNGCLCKIASQALFEICEKGHAGVVVENGAVPKLVDLVKSLSHNDVDVCWNAARALGMICKEHAGVVVENDAVPELAKLLSSDDVNVRSNATFAVCKICKTHAGVVVEKGAVPGLVKCLSYNDLLGYCRNAAHCAGSARSDTLKSSSRRAR